MCGRDLEKARDPVMQGWMEEFETRARTGELYIIRILQQANTRPARHRGAHNGMNSASSHRPSDSASTLLPQTMSKTMSSLALATTNVPQSHKTIINALVNRLRVKVCCSFGEMGKAYVAIAPLQFWIKSPCRRIRCCSPAGRRASHPALTHATPYSYLCT